MPKSFPRELCGLICCYCTGPSFSCACHPGVLDTLKSVYYLSETAWYLFCVHHRVSIVGNHKRNWYHRSYLFLSLPSLRIYCGSKGILCVPISLWMHNQGMAGVCVMSEWEHRKERGLMGSCSSLPLRGSNSQASSSALRKPAVSIADSTELRWVRAAVGFGQRGD